MSSWEASTCLRKLASSTQRKALISSFRRVLTKDRTRTGHSQKIVPGLETFSQVRNVSPDLSEARVQRLTRAGGANANPNVVRVPS